MLQLIIQATEIYHIQIVIECALSENSNSPAVNSIKKTYTQIWGQIKSRETTSVRLQTGLKGARTGALVMHTLHDTDKHLGLIMTLLCSLLPWQTPWRYQVHYLPASLSYPVDNEYGFSDGLCLIGILYTHLMNYMPECMDHKCMNTQNAKWSNVTVFGVVRVTVPFSTTLATFWMTTINLSCSLVTQGRGICARAPLGLNAPMAS